MRAYRVTFKNSGEWVLDGRIEEEIMIIADDFTEATVMAQDQLAELKESLTQENHNDKYLNALRIYAISEIYEDVIGVIGKNLKDSMSHWTARIAKKIEERDNR